MPKRKNRFPKKSARPSPRKKSVQRVRTLTAKQIGQILAAQRETRRLSKQRETARAARDTFKAKKSDRGKLLMVGTKGQRAPQSKGRKGYLVYVTRTGKKWLIKQAQKTEPYKARKLTDIEPPARKNLKRATTQFQTARRQKISQSKVIVKGSGKVKTGGQWDFNDSAVSKIAASIRKTIERQASHRTFLIVVNALIELPGGRSQTITFELPIDRPDHIAIRLAGIKNFVRQKFYAFMARELVYLGFVSSGSANHIRSLGGNAGKPRSKWRDRRGESWVGRNLTVTKILAIEWKIEQIQ